jgi:hypothetical protein
MKVRGLALHLSSGEGGSNNWAQSYAREALSNERAARFEVFSTINVESDARWRAHEVKNSSLSDVSNTDEQGSA